MIPPAFEIRARELVLEAVELRGELWRHVTPATLELLVEAVASDLQEREESRERRENLSDPPRDRTPRSTS